MLSVYILGEKREANSSARTYVCKRTYECNLHWIFNASDQLEQVQLPTKDNNRTVNADSRRCIHSYLLRT